MSLSRPIMDRSVKNPGLIDRERKSTGGLSRTSTLGVRRGMQRAFSFFVLVAAAAGALGAMGGCNAQLATVLVSDDGATVPSTNDGSSPDCPNGVCPDGGPTADASTSTSDCVKLGGICLPKG